MPLPAIVAVGTISAVIVPLVVKVLVALGVGFATYTGMTAVLDVSLAYIVERFEELPLEVLSMLALLNIDRAFTMLLSAFAVRLALAGVNSSGALSKFQVKGLGGQ